MDIAGRLTGLASIGFIAMRAGFFGYDNFAYHDNTERLAHDFRISNGLLWSCVNWRERFVETGKDVDRVATFYRPVRVFHYTLGATEHNMLKETGKLPWEFNPNDCKRYV